MSNPFEMQRKRPVRNSGAERLLMLALVVIALGAAVYGLARDDSRETCERNFSRATCIYNLR